VRKAIPIQVRVESARRPSFEDRLRELSQPLQALDQASASERFQVPGGASLLKTTLSLCPQCLAHVQAAVYVDGGKVFINKECAKHGLSRALLENDARYYRLSNKDQWGRRYAEQAVVETPAFTVSGCCAPGSSCGPRVLRRFQG
jgi:uncharacterized radical SAM superfamily Fe-S cluster-containing enzyme